MYKDNTEDFNCDLVLYLPTFCPEKLFLAPPISILLMPSIVAGHYADIDEPTPTGRNPPRCSNCGERMKGHNIELCLRIGTFKDAIRGEVSSASRPIKLEHQHTEMPSVSHANELKHTVPVSVPSPDNKRIDKEKGIYLAASNLPNLTTRYTPIIEMRALLELRGIHLTHFHITEEQDWAFVVTGNRRAMAKWVLKSKESMAISAAPRRSCLRTTFFIVLVLAVTAGILAFLIPPLETV